MVAYIGWIDGNVSANPQQRGLPGVVAGGQVLEFVQSWAKKTTDGNGTVYFLAEVGSDALITSLLLNNDALTGATSADLGLYEVDPSMRVFGVDQTAADYNAAAPISGNPSGTNPKLDAGNIFMSATDISAGSANGSERNGLANITVQTITTLGATTNGLLNFGLKVWQLLGFTDPKWKSAKYAIGLRLNTAGAAAGNLVVRGRYVQG